MATFPRKTDKVVRNMKFYTQTLRTNRQVYRANNREQVNQLNNRSDDS